jgi:hypothetical protein
MQIEKDIRKLNDTHPFLSDFLQPGDLFLDIETTGLSKERSRIYLIGEAEFTGADTLLMCQLFAEDPSQEAAVLAAFTERLSAHEIRRLITFNGQNFDLPFLLARADAHGIPLAFDHLQSFDIYKETRKLKNILQLQNYKQKTIEQFLGCHREDPYSGGQLIAVYQDYAKTRDTSARQMLLLHNYEDVLGMSNLLQILSYRSFFEEDVHVLDASLEDYRDSTGNPSQELILTLQPPYPLPGTRLLRHPVSDVYLSLGGPRVRMRIPLCDGTVRLYYADYKNYYYLPAEDMAIHKSLASYVDKTHRQKATPDNCYTKVTVTDAFLRSPQLTEYAAHVLKSFRI